MTMAETVANLLREVIGSDAFDLIPDPSGGWVDITTDEWTIHLEGSPVTTAWVALDDEPDDPEGLAVARQRAMSPAVDQALATANQQLGGALASALATSDDPLSLDLMAAITGTVPRS